MLNISLRKREYFGKGGHKLKNDKMLIWLSNLSKHLQALKTDIITTLTFVLNMLEIGPEVLEKRTKILKAYNDNKNNDNMNNDNNNNFRWEKLRCANKKNLTDQTDIHPDGQTKTERQIRVHLLTNIVVHKHQRTL